MLLNRLSVLFVASFAALAQSTTNNCKESHLTAGWPDPLTWIALNKTVDDNLLAPLPPAIVCGPGEAEYDPAECEIVNEA